MSGSAVGLWLTAIVSLVILPLHQAQVTIFVPATVRVSEGTPTGQVQVCVQVSGDRESTISELTTSEDSPVSAVATRDFRIPNTTVGVIIVPACFSIPVTNDSALEGDETFIATLRVRDGAPISIGNAVTIITIIDDDAVAVSLPAILIVGEGDSGVSRDGFRDGSAFMGDATVLVCATLSAVEETERNFTITLATSDGTAMAGSDYTSVSSIEVFHSGSSKGTTRCVDITILDDNALEGDQTFTVTLTTSDHDVMLVINVTTITITDNEDLAITPSKPPSVLLGDYISLNCSPLVPTSELNYTWTHINTSTVLEETSNILTFPRISTEELGTYRCSVLLTSAAEITITSARPLIEIGSYPVKMSRDSCPSPQTSKDILVDVLQLLSAHFGLHPLGLTKAYSAESCAQVAQANPNSPPGMYWVYSVAGNPVQVICQF